MRRVKWICGTVLLLALTSGCLRVSGLNYGPHHYAGQDPNKQTVIPLPQLNIDVTLVGAFAERMRVFGCDANFENAMRKARSLPEVIRPKIYAQAWISRDTAENQRQIDCLIRVCKEGLCDLAIVGSETQLRQDVSEEQLLAYINQVQSALRDVPVGTADTYNVLLDHPAVLEASDVILANIYPFWEGVPVERASQFIHDRYQVMQEAAGGKHVIVAETGWPSCGDPVGDAVPSEANAEFFFANIVTWSRKEKAEVLFFEAFDEPWKEQYEGTVGRCWGMTDSNYYIKPGRKRVFKEMFPTPVNWTNSGIPGGPGTPELTFSDVPPVGSTENLYGKVLHVHVAEYGVAVYIKVRGRWWIKPFANAPLTSIAGDGVFVTDITTGGVDAEASEVAAFVLRRNYPVPIALNWIELPQSLYSDAAAYAVAQR